MIPRSSTYTLLDIQGHSVIEISVSVVRITLKISENAVCKITTTIIVVVVIKIIIIIT